MKYNYGISQPQRQLNYQDKEMEHITKFEKRKGADIGYNNSNLHPANREGCVGKSGIDKTFTLERVIALAYQMVERPNIIIKAGVNAKWYLKRCPIDEIEREIENQKNWRDVSRCVMHIIEWDE
jgi:hypothetical protein